MLVNIRSGATFNRVDSPTEYKRISSTGLGASTLVGMIKLLWGENDPSQTILESIHGTSEDIDMSVGDIYGKKGYTSLGLPEKLVASFFGKLKDSSQEEIKALKKEDINKSLVTMVLFNTLGLANMIAK